METEPNKIPPPPGLIHSLASGFNAVATHILVIALPVLLDLFLWLGPHLRLKQLLQPFVDRLPDLLASPLVANMPDPQTVVQAWTDFISRFNLFGILHTFPIGVSTLMSLQMPIQTPLGTPPDLEVGSIFSLVATGLSLIILGWLVGGLYYLWVSTVTLNLDARSLWQSLGQTFLLSVIWTALLFIFGLPAFVLFSIMAVISPIVAEVALFIFAVLALWLVMPIFFSPHGIFTYQQNAFHAILNSLRMVRFTLPNTGLFLLAFLLIGQGFDFLWRTPADNSWLTLVGIAGHAFISTALLAASFIYYRDMNAWLKLVFERLKAQATSARL
ncbi:MAG: hypothetical protein ABSB41_08065 [Anaerolineales bacterium]